MRYRIEARGPQASPAATLHAETASHAYKLFMAHKGLFGGAEAFDAGGPIDEGSLYAAAVSEGWRPDA